MDQVDFNKLWQNFLDTVTNHYMDFNGRVGRAQFWWYILVVVVLSIGVSIVASVTVHLLSTLFSLAMLLPNLGMNVRRLHDVGKPGIWVLILAVPLLLMILLGLLVVLSAGLLFGLLFLTPLISLLALAAAAVMIYFCVQPGDAGSNAYGPPPPVWTPGAPAAPPAT
jgi:uncharacterized membrane protein YhaH (DUF805 family)